jgi:CheY-like chemotaxis protein
MPKNSPPAKLLVIGPESDLRGLILNLLESQGWGSRLAIVSKDPGHLVRSLLERDGHQVHVNPTWEAFEAVVSGAPDLVVLDLEALEGLMHELQTTQESLKQIAELVPICAQCKNVRHPDDSWEPIESYLQSHLAVQFTHTLCPKHLDLSDVYTTALPTKPDKGLK